VRDSHVTFRGSEFDDRRSARRELAGNGVEPTHVSSRRSLQNLSHAAGPDSGFNFTNACANAVIISIPAPSRMPRMNRFTSSSFTSGAKLVPTVCRSSLSATANDDDAERSLGSDSKLLFTPPQDGNISARHRYSRPKAATACVPALVAPGSTRSSASRSAAQIFSKRCAGKGFKVTANRIDGLTAIFASMSKTCLAASALFLPCYSIRPSRSRKERSTRRWTQLRDRAESKAIKVTATATINGRTVTREVNNLAPSLLPPNRSFSSRSNRMRTCHQLHRAPPFPKSLWNYPSPRGNRSRLAQGQTQRHEDLVTFSIDNLPHGVIVDNIGLTVS